MKNSLGIRRALILLALGGSTFTFTVFGPSSFGCNYALNSDYQNLLTSIGDGVIDTLAEACPSCGSDWDAIVQEPVIDFAHAVWANWVDYRIPDDLPNNPITRR